MIVSSLLLNLISVAISDYLLQEDTAILISDMSKQIEDLLAANKALRAENERLRRIY